MSDRKLNMEGRTFTAMDGYIQDEDFDFDAGLLVTGDFIDSEKSQYAQMIADVLNKHAELKSTIAELETKLAEKNDLANRWIDEALRLGELNAKHVGQIRMLADLFTVNMIRAFPEKSHEEVQAEIDRILNPAE